MKMKCRGFLFAVWILFTILFMWPGPLSSRIKLVALPERGKTVIRLDNPRATLIQEERILTLQKGLNRVDFSWEGVRVDEDSIRLSVLSHPFKAVLLSVSYPPGEAALVWEIHSEDALEVTVRITYLLGDLDRIVAYKGLADKAETGMHLRSHMVIRNFSGQDFVNASLLLGEGLAFERSLAHGETQRLLFLEKDTVPMEKVWTFDARALPWDPEDLDMNVGIPVGYRIKNVKESGLGRSSLPTGKFRVFQADGQESTLFLGEDRIHEVPVGEEVKVSIGESRDIVVTQRKMKEEQINARRNKRNQVVLYDTDEVIKATIENFKDKPAQLTMVQHIPGQWDMESCNTEYEKRDAYTLVFEIALPARGMKELIMHYHRRNLR
jgi:hypothetical protein